MSASREDPVCVVYPDRVGVFTFGVFKTSSERSWGRLREEGSSESEGKERWVKGEENVFFLQAVECYQTVLEVHSAFYLTILPLSPPLQFESINKTRWDREKSGREKGARRRHEEREKTKPRLSLLWILLLERPPEAPKTSDLICLVWRYFIGERRSKPGIETSTNWSGWRLRSYREVSCRYVADQPPSHHVPIHLILPAFMIVLKPFKPSNLRDPAHLRSRFPA